MSLYLRRIALDGFKKFRNPVVIDGLTDGLNIVIEPNETGKSTLLDALRAAFFVRHGTRNQLAQSYAPHGDAVGPEIKVSFDAAGSPWTLTKRFLKSPMIEVTGPQGRAQGDEAEARLHALLGSIRDTSQRGDAGSYGALGLLWVAQMDALSVTAPGQIVRDTVRSTLEAEVGSIMGGPAYERVRARVDEQFGQFWSPTGQRRGRQNDASARVDAAESVAREAAERLAGLERTFADLDAARARLKVVQREIADDTDAGTRTDLVASLEVARAAAQILATRRAEHEAIGARLRGLDDIAERHAKAVDDRTRADGHLAQIREQRAALGEGLASAKLKVAETRTALETARAASQRARSSLADGEQTVRAARRSDAVADVRRRYARLLELEQEREQATAIAATSVAAETVALLEASDRTVAEARALRAAGATRIVFSGDLAGISVDGAQAVAGEATLAGETQVTLGAAALTIVPPAGAASAEEVLAAAMSRQQSAYDDLGLADLAAVRARNDAARDASSDLRAIAAQIDAITPADTAIGLEAGAAALKLFFLGLDLGDESDAGADDQTPAPDIAALAATLEAADLALARAEGTHDSAVNALRLLEEDDAPLAIAEAGAASDLANVVAQIGAIEGRAEFATLVEDCSRGREQAAEAAVRLENAERDATAHDVGAITRRIETIDARGLAAIETRTRLETDIARLEGTVESEGGKGLAEREAAAREELEAAQAALQRVTDEADTLKLLRATLDEARDETSAKFVGPVARRAKRHIERLLPGCELTFSEDLALEAVIRNGFVEGCGDLSRGTQEQLAILTRIAFADMLLEQGCPVSLILDDPLVYSDDARLDLMVEILTEAADRMQVILLTCRDRAFRHVPANRLSLAEAAA